MQKILILLTGGTIEKTYSETQEKNVFSEESNMVIQNILEKNIRIQDVDIEYVRVMQKDSLDMNDADRDKIFLECSNSNAEKIIITHGTSTMTKTADLLLNDSNLLEKTIVFTGAMRPYLLHGNSDAAANISSALTTVQLKERGMFLTMNGKIFPVGQVKKNVDAGVFENV